MPRRESLKKPLCLCCNTNRSVTTKDNFCRNCKNFVYIKLHLTNGFINSKLYNKSYDRRIYSSDGHCSFCGNEAVISYKHYKLQNKFYLCQSHLDRWLKIGCELSEFAKLL